MKQKYYSIAMFIAVKYDNPVLGLSVLLYMFWPFL